MPDTNPIGPPTVFTDRFWDWKDHWWPEGVGIIPNSLRPYFGAIPGPEVTPLVGTEGEWIAGFEYARWIAGGYPQAPCWNVHAPAQVFRLEQSQRIRVPIPHRLLASHSQDIVFWNGVLSLAQAQDITFSVPVPFIWPPMQEVEDIELDYWHTLALQQSEDIELDYWHTLGLSQSQDIFFS